MDEGQFWGNGSKLLLKLSHTHTQPIAAPETLLKKQRPAIAI
jgi:hypothetical protein